MIRSFLYKSKRKYQEYQRLRRILGNLTFRLQHEEMNYLSYIQIVKQYPDFAPSQKDSEILKLMELASQKEVKTVCEIGSYKGGSFLLLAQAAQSDTMLISVDLNFPQGRKFLYKNIGRANQRIKCIEGNTQNPKTVESVRRALSGRKIDLLFIDGDHSFFGVMNDFVRFSPLMSEKGIIAFHDIHPDFRMRYGVDSPSYVGGVPIFWEAIKKSGLTTTEIIEDQEQDGFGLGLYMK